MTRALVIVQDDEGAPLATIYLHSDGYPTGAGAKLKSICPTRIGAPEHHGPQAGPPGVARNELRASDTSDLAGRVVLGMGSAGPGSLRLTTAGTRGIGEEYVYVVQPAYGIASGDRPRQRRVRLTVKAISWAPGQDDRTLYDGPVEQFDPVEAERVERPEADKSTDRQRERSEALEELAAAVQEIDAPRTGGGTAEDRGGKAASDGTAGKRLLEAARRLLQTQ